MLCIFADLHFFHQSLMFLAGQRVMVEKRWREFFTDPSQWWDNRMEKVITTLLLGISLFYAVQ
jgi:hypothetical protein